MLIIICCNPFVVILYHGIYALSSVICHALDRPDSPARLRSGAELPAPRTHGKWRWISLSPLSPLVWAQPACRMTCTPSVMSTLLRDMAGIGSCGAACPSACCAVRHATARSSISTLGSCPSQLSKHQPGEHRCSPPLFAACPAGSVLPMPAHFACGLLCPEPAEELKSSRLLCSVGVPV